MGINDPTQKKPEDWVEESRIKDPEASQPPEWDEDEDGKWEAPTIDNPKYKGAWHTTMIDNPAYVAEVYPHEDIGAVGFELWTVNDGSIFDNILICDSWDHAKKVGEEIKKLQDKEKDAKKAWDKANGKDTSDVSPPAGASDDDDDDDSEQVDLDKDKKKEL